MERRYVAWVIAVALVALPASITLNVLWIRWVAGCG